MWPNTSFVAAKATPFLTQVPETSDRPGKATRPRPAGGVCPTDVVVVMLNATMLNVWSGLPESHVGMAGRPH